MEENTIKFIISFGLCVLSPCFSQIYHVVNERKTWIDAQSYCREKYTDLVTINSTEVMATVRNILKDPMEEFWIGLYSDMNNWKWSLEKDGFYGEGQSDFRMWNSGEPNDLNSNFSCVDIQRLYGWSDYKCDAKRTFVCYNDAASNYTFVNISMTWNDAQLYCRAHYTDLASVRNLSENQKINTLVTGYAWIGMYKESWKWSDGKRYTMTSFTNFAQGQALKVNSCATTTNSTWNIRLCNSTYHFICFDQRIKQVVKLKVVKLKVLKPDVSLDMNVTQDILNKLSSRLQDHGMEDFKLKWVKQSDGKTFHLKTKEEKTAKDKK